METPATPTLPRRPARLKVGAKHVGVSTMTLHRRILDGTIRGYRSPRGAVFVDLDELDELYFTPISVDASSAP